MFDKRKLNLLILAVLTIGFLYRFSLTTINTYPPGSDIGLHESVINSIINHKTNFTQNYYHMGGGLSATNPGYHIFAAFIIVMTGAPDYLVQAVVASLFSSLIILCAYLVTKVAWGELAGLIVAILVTFSASDIVMLNWGGYPNIVALMLIPLLFYLFLQPAKLCSKLYLIITSLLVGALFLTHIFSAIVFLVITLFALSLGIMFSKTTGLSIKKALFWLMPIFFGVLLVLPYLASIVPIYFGSQGAITGTVTVNQQALVETRIPPVFILSLAVIPVFLFPLFSKLRNGKFVSLAAILFEASVLVPLVATQGNLFGYFLDYERFLYFLSLPVIVCVALIIVYLARIFSQPNKKIKLFNVSFHFRYFLVSVLIIASLFTPLFALPSVGVNQANYFQVMTNSKYEALQWIKANTPGNSVFVAEANYGWWLSGFAQRPTLSAVDPQFLILQREFEPAEVASNLLKADYLVDNGLLQIQQSGAHANSNDIYAMLNNSYIHPLVFSLNDTQISLLYRDESLPKEVKLGAFAQSDTKVSNDGNSASFIISRLTSIFNVTEEITVFRGVRFAEISFTLQSQGSVAFDWLRIPFQARGLTVQYANSIGIVDNTMHQVNQIVFPNAKLGSDVAMEQNSDFYQLIYNLASASTAHISFFVGIYPLDNVPKNNQNNYYNSLIENYSKTYVNVVSDLPLNCFNYHEAISKWQVSYIALTDIEEMARFSSDPTFILVFKNSEVAIFKIANK
jgi:hypothetical protein